MINIRNLSKRMGNTLAVDNVSLSIESGTLLCIIGSSGSGKTTLLRTLNRMIVPDAGEIWIDNRKIAEFGDEELRRKTGYVLQNAGLFPHYSVERNIGLVPSLLKWPKPKIKARVREMLDLVKLPHSDYANRYPHELSGGEQQRVGIARALAADPNTILFDEPFSALDPITRHEMQLEIIRLKEILRKTMVFVTHDISEAFLLADKIAILDHGVLLQMGTPDEIKSDPKSDFIKDFIHAGKIA